MLTKEPIDLIGLSRGRRGCQHLLALLVTDGPNHTEGQPYPSKTLHYLVQLLKDDNKAAAAAAGLKKESFDH